MRTVIPHHDDHANRPKPLTLSSNALTCRLSSAVGASHGTPPRFPCRHPARLGRSAPQTVRADDVPSLVITDQVVGTGNQARSDSEVRINYTGWLYDAKAPDHHGAKFDSSYDSGHPLDFTVDADEVIAGMDSGVKGMRVGGKRTVIVPSRQGYGSRGSGHAIPPNSALVFEIELLESH